VAYVGDDGKVYCYREQYLEDLSIEAITDEIGVGTCIEAIQLDDCFYHFYISAGALYVRKQGEYSNTLITPGSGEITEVWAAAMPDDVYYYNIPWQRRPAAGCCITLTQT
jgi:hypothetical protein